MTRQKWATVGAVVLLLLVFAWGQKSGLPAKQRQTQQDADQAILIATVVCKGQNEIRLGFRSYVLKQIGRAEKALPGIEYYKNHPVELGKQLALIERQKADTREQFRAKPC